jgi:hypothetical protein
MNGEGIAMKYNLGSWRGAGSKFIRKIFENENYCRPNSEILKSEQHMKFHLLV